ncbi:putative disease resistance protein RGA3 [Setaria italica]|uniref:putative disease resistance protein RGA3 n=1 Tax=Setaria italica TaxID=4555 RepID=UPI000BE54F2E|nr:putative disease resistance protein RGA3 [Setaria italica]
MAESLLLPVVRGVVGKAADALVQSITRMWGVDKDRLKLERHLVYVQSLLADAEAKSETNHAVRTWMKELKAAAYQADDVLDDFQYEALRREALSGQSMASKILSNFTSKNRLVFRHKASRDLKNVLEKIDELVTEMTKFGLVALPEAPPQALPRQTHSALDESMEIFGREGDKDGVVELLLDQQDQQDVQVLPILGMGGVGKTTLAKMVYNNDKIQKHFELRMWHCVSENFEAIPLVRSVIELATNSTCGLPDTIELLRGKLQEAIGRKRFLLILDDVWNEDQNKWEDDLRPLLCSSIGGSGSTIVVTSRSRQVASIMGTLPPHELVCLSEDDSWELFSKKAFSKGVQEQAKFVKIGRCISNKCKGLPLALKTMGGLMSSKQQIEEWEAIADCNISDTNRGKDEVLPILKLSYKHLSPEMKQCFAFCSLFPKDYEMEKDMLIQLWMANGYLHEEGTMDLTQKGEYIFNELAWRSFFQDVILVREPYFMHASKQEINGCKMHDLMHDLAKDVANECANAEELIQQNMPVNDVHHLHIRGNYQLNKISQLLGGTMYLRTLLMPPSSYKDLMKSKLMPSRALSILCRDTSIVHMLTRTAHLRYLDLSYSSIVSLPNSICMLYNLLSLRLNHCSLLQYLPEGMRTMRKLCHIYLLGCGSLERMPPKLSVLHNLRTLTRFVVGTKDGCGIEELEDLRQIGGRLELYNLQEVKCGSKANLHEKHNLNELLLYWDHFREATNHEQVWNLLYLMIS